MKILRNLFLGFLLSVMTCGSVWAQATAQISGTVTDSTGALIPGVEVTASQTATGASRTVVTNETGSYIMTNLALGPYRLEATLPGFSTFLQTGLVLQVGDSPVVNIALEVGQVAQTIEVTANVALVETRNVSISQVMETARIVALPLNGRNVQQLLVLQGGATEAMTEGGYAFPNRMTISAAGALGFSTDYTLDGIRHLDPYDGLALPLPFPDALSEFKTEIGGMSAAQHRSAQVSSVTRSGTNEFHGNLFEFVRNDLFNARHHGSRTRSTLKRNQYGGTFGGPALRNRLFFFGGFQGTNIRADSSSEEAFIPTPAMLQGDFSAIASDACAGSGGLGRLGTNIEDDFPTAFDRDFGGQNPFDANNQIDTQFLDPVALALVARFPNPIDECGQVIFGEFENQDLHQWLTRVDYQMSDNFSLFGRYMFSQSDIPSGFQFDTSNILSSSNGTLAKNYAATVGSTYVISPTVIYSLRLSATRTRQRRFPSDLGFDATALGANVYSDAIPGAPAIEVDDNFNLGGNIRRLGLNLFQLQNDVSMTIGSHQINFGGLLSEARTTTVSGTTLAPNFNFTDDFTGHALGDFLLGRPSSFIQSRGNENISRMKFHALWVNDTWQARPGVTISAGVRWAPTWAFVDFRRPVPNSVFFDMDLYRSGTRSDVFPNQPPGFVYAGDATFPFETNVDASQFPGDGSINVGKPRADLWTPHYNQFAPRVGLAWDVQGDGRTSLRASYGLAFEQYPTIYRLGSAQAQPPWGNSSRIIFPPGGFQDPWATDAQVAAGTLSDGGPFPSVSALDAPLVLGGTYLPAEPDLKATYTQSWNLSLQREVTTGTLLSATYLGTSIIHTQAAIAINPSIFIPGVGDANGNCFFTGTFQHFDGRSTSLDGVLPYTVGAGSACSTNGNTGDRRELALLSPEFTGEIGRMGLVVGGGTQNYHGMLLSMTHRTSGGRSMNVNYTWSHCLGDYLGRSNGGYGSSANHTFQDRDDRSQDRGNCRSDERHAFNLSGVVQSPEFANPTLRVLGSGWQFSAIFRRNSGGNAGRSSDSVANRTVTIGRPARSQAGASGGDNPLLNDIDNQRPVLLSNDIYNDTSGAAGTVWLNRSAFGTPDPALVGQQAIIGAQTLRLPVEMVFDIGISREFQIRETHIFEFRTEVFNVMNNYRPNVRLIQNYLSSRRFGQLRSSDALDQRILQFAVKYSF